MCLIVSKSDIEKTEEIRKHSGKMIAYKVVTIPYKKKSLRSVYFNHKWKPGWNKSNRKSVGLSNSHRRGLEYGQCDIDEGIHVYLTRTEANINGSWYNDRVVEVECYNKDLVGFRKGRCNQAVFTKVFLPKKEHDRALKGT